MIFNTVVGLESQIFEIFFSLFTSLKTTIVFVGLAVLQPPRTRRQCWRVAEPRTPALVFKLVNTGKKTPEVEVATTVKGITIPDHFFA